MNARNTRPKIDVQDLAAQVPAHLAVPIGPGGRSRVEWSRKFLEDAVRIVLNSRDPDQVEALHSQFTDYVAALVHVAGRTRPEAIREASQVVEPMLQGAAGSPGREPGRKPQET